MADFENRLINIKCANRRKLNPNSRLITVVKIVTSCSDSAQREKGARIGTRLHAARAEQSWQILQTFLIGAS